MLSMDIIPKTIIIALTIVIAWVITMGPTPTNPRERNGMDLKRAD